MHISGRLPSLLRLEAPGAGEVGTLFTNNHVLHWFHHQILWVNKDTRTWANVDFDAQLRWRGKSLAARTFSVAGNARARAYVWASTTISALETLQPLVGVQRVAK